MRELETDSGLLVPKNLILLCVPGETHTEGGIETSQLLSQQHGFIA